jgi:hypothetical protein
VRRSGTIPAGARQYDAEDAERQTERETIGDRK